MEDVLHDIPVGILGFLPDADSTRTLLDWGTEVLRRNRLARRGSLSAVPDIVITELQSPSRTESEREISGQDTYKNRRWLSVVMLTSESDAMKEVLV